MKLDGIEHIKFNDVLKTPNELLSNTIPISFTASIDKWSLANNSSEVSETSWFDGPSMKLHRKDEAATETITHMVTVATGDNEYGNGTSIFTTSSYNASKYENEINITQCGINVPIPVSPPYYSWTSGKESYRGSHYIYGPSSFEFYTQTKTIMKKNILNSEISISMPTN